MKKRNILFIFLISFIVFINNVSAASDLTCTYHYTCTMNNNFTSAYSCSTPLMIIQKDNIIKYYDSDLEGFRNDGSTSAIEWFEVKNINADFSKTEKYNETSKTLDSCPPCFKDGKEYKFSDKKNNDKCPSDYEELKNESTIAESTENFCKNYSSNRDIEQEISNTKWDQKCKYENGDNKVELYFNNERSLMWKESKITKYCITISQILNDSNGYCPMFIYYNKSNDTYYLTKETQQGYASDSLMLTNYSSDKKENEKVNINNCSDLFGEDLIKEINNVMKIIRLIVPIIILIFGITDFSRATIESSEENMKKKRDTFIKRLIAAILVFLVPTIVTLLLHLGNSVWSFISPDTCVEERE